MFLLVLYPAARTGFQGTPTVGGGGEGPAGGGGGGSAGDDLPAGERLQFIQLNQRPAADAAAVVAPPAKPVEPPKVAEEPKPTPPAAAPPAGPASPAPSSGLGGSGTGAGITGGPGAGPGSAGGVGSGIGTGTGSGTGPGTGGGPGANYPPTPTQFFLPPLPAPASLKGYHLTAYFDVDEKGSAKLLGFNPSRDASYNRKLRDVLLALRFRPGTRANGTPVRDTVDIQFIF